MAKSSLLLPLLLVLAAGCTADHVTTQQEDARIQEIKLEKKRLEQSVHALETHGQALMAAMAEAVAEGDEARRMEITTELAVQKAQWESEVSRWERLTDEQTRIEEQAIERTVNNVTTTALPFIPAPLQPFTVPLSALMASLLFKRPRENYTKAMSNLAKGRVFDAALDMASGVGLKHTNENPEDVIGASISMLRKEGDLDSAEELKGLLSNIRERRVKDGLEKTRRTEGLR